MMLSWGNWDVRVNAASAWVSLASRFAGDNGEIVDQIDAIMNDPVASVRLQAAQNLQVISAAAPDRMWALGERLARVEPNAEIVSSYLRHPLQLFSHSVPERCEVILAIIRERMAGDLRGLEQGRDSVQDVMGYWAAQLYAGQGRALLRGWLDVWASDPEHYQTLLNSYTSSLREVFFLRYGSEVESIALSMNERAQESLLALLKAMFSIHDEAYAVLSSDVDDAVKKLAAERYGSAVKVIHHAMNQLYFGSGAHGEREGSRPVLKPHAMSLFLADYAEILTILSASREPATLHHLVELYEYLIPGDPIAVFNAIHSILVGSGEAEGYHHESLGTTAVVRIMRRFLADHRAIFDNEDRRSKLVQILQLFSRSGWTEALRLLYELPDLLR